MWAVSAMWGLGGYELLLFSVISFSRLMVSSDLESDHNGCRGSLNNHIS